MQRAYDRRRRRTLHICFPVDFLFTGRECLISLMNFFSTVTRLYVSGPARLCLSPCLFCLSLTLAPSPARPLAPLRLTAGRGRRGRAEAEAEQQRRDDYDQRPESPSRVTSELMSSWSGLSLSWMRLVRIRSELRLESISKSAAAPSLLRYRHLAPGPRHLFPL